MKAAKYKNFEIADKAKIFFLQYNYPAQPIFAPKPSNPIYQVLDSSCMSALEYDSVLCVRVFRRRPNQESRNFADSLDSFSKA